MKRIAKIVTILGLTTVSLGVNSNTTYAIGHSSAHPSSHPSAHPSSHPVSHPTPHPTTSRPVSTPSTSRNSTASKTGGVFGSRSSVQKNSGTHTSASKENVGTIKENSKQVSPTTRAISRLPQTTKVSKSIERAKTTTTYHSLSSNSYRSDYLYWHGYCDAYYRRPMFSYYYPWMPWWFWNSHNHETNKIKQEAKKKDMRWIKVGDKVIAVPKKIYDKIKVGDTVELTDDTHIKINGHVYTR
ncbi:hypothetical protein [Lactobacillus taiwanensis]|uniref:hypothetical protein n=1 Tax=Lactobacillus taiwanensis TaxID=508451 RepID=UPI0025B0942B|nr:hypothetical protein [Lactobacillus taiwanensis]